MTSRNAFAWFVAFLLVISSVVAADESGTDLITASGEDFTASGTGRILTFACSPAAEGNITVINTGSVQSVYELVAEGDARKWVSFEPLSFVLNPGQSQLVREYFNIPCDAEDSAIDVSILTAELELVLSQDIVIQAQNNIALTPIIYSREILPCDTADFSFMLGNPSDFAETYSLTVSGSPEETTISEDVLVLEPNKNSTVTITVHPDDCSLSGDFTPVLRVSTAKSRIASEIEMYLQINDSYIPIIAEGIDTIRAGFEPQEAQIKIENTGDRTASYLLSVESATWITVQPEEITISARDSENAKLILQSNENTTPGNYPVVITATVEATGREYQKELSIVLKTPGFIANMFTDYLWYTIGIVILLIILIVLIVWAIRRYNSPEAQERREERRKLKQEKAANKAAERQSRIAQKEREEAEEAKKEERHERELERERLIAQKEYEKQIRRENVVISKESIALGFKAGGKKFLKFILFIAVLAIIAIALKYSNVIARNIVPVIAGIAILLVMLIFYRIRKNKFARSKYKLALANKTIRFTTKWKKGLTEVAFKLNTVVDKLVMTARRIKPTVPHYSDCAYNTFVVDANVEQGTISEARIMFKVKKSWMLRHNVAQNAVRLYHLGADRWDSIVAEPVRTDEKYAYFTADTEGVGEFAIVGKPGKKQKKKGIAKWLLPAIFIIVALIAVVSLAIILQSKTQTIGIPAQVFKQDTSHTLDLGQYFKDPDNDVLKYNVTQTSNVTILFSGNNAIITPNYGWRGTERVVFTADDGKGGIVSSNPVEIVVEQDVIPSYWKKNAGTILEISAAVLILLALIIFRKQFKKMIGLE